MTSGVFWEAELDPLPLLAPYFVGLGDFVTKKMSREKKKIVFLPSNKEIKQTETIDHN